MELWSGPPTVPQRPVKLAKLKTDLNAELETHHLRGAMKQVAYKDDMDAMAEI